LNGIPAAKASVWAAFVNAVSVDAAGAGCDGALSVLRAAALAAVFFFASRPAGGVVAFGMVCSV
jgi:hypothetical protein